MTNSSIPDPLEAAQTQMLLDHVSTQYKGWLRLDGHAYKDLRSMGLSRSEVRKIVTRLVAQDRLRVIADLGVELIAPSSPFWASAPSAVKGPNQ